MLLQKVSLPDFNDDGNLGFPLKVLSINEVIIFVEIKLQPKFWLRRSFTLALHLAINEVVSIPSYLPVIAIIIRTLVVLGGFPKSDASTIRV